MDMEIQKKESKQAEDGKMSQTGLYYPVNHSSFASDKEYHQVKGQNLLYNIVKADGKIDFLLSIYLFPIVTLRCDVLEL